MIAIVDYGAGNLRNVQRALERLGYVAQITQSPGEVSRAAVVILPGVGAAGDAMRGLTLRGLAEALLETIAQGKPLLGVCLGLQLLFSRSEESPGQDCLGVIRGPVKRLPPGLKVPHMGWNQVCQKTPHPVFQDIPDGANFYFVHSYYGEPRSSGWTIGETEYGVAFASVVARDNIVATQFHPEKSGELGLRFYDNFLRFAGMSRD